MKNILLYLSQLSKIFRALFGAGLILLIIVLILSAHQNINSQISILAIFVFAANNSLAIVFYQKDRVVPYILAITSMLVSIFSILCVVQ